MTSPRTGRPSTTDERIEINLFTEAAERPERTLPASHVFFTHLGYEIRWLDESCLSQIISKHAHILLNKVKLIVLLKRRAWFSVTEHQYPK